MHEVIVKWPVLCLKGGDMDKTLYDSVLSIEVTYLFQRDKWQGIRDKERRQRERNKGGRNGHLPMLQNTTASKSVSCLFTHS